MQVCDCEKVGGVTIVAVVMVAIDIVDAMLTVVVTVTVVVLTAVAIVVIIPPYSPSPSLSSSFSAYVGHHWHRRSRFISSSLPPRSSPSSAVVHAFIAIVTISISIWFVLQAVLPELHRLAEDHPAAVAHPAWPRLSRRSFGSFIGRSPLDRLAEEHPVAANKTNERQASFQNEL